LCAAFSVLRKNRFADERIPLGSEQKVEGIADGVTGHQKAMLQVGFKD